MVRAACSVAVRVVALLDFKLLQTWVVCAGFLGRTCFFTPSLRTRRKTERGQEKVEPFQECACQLKERAVGQLRSCLSSFWQVGGWLVWWRKPFDSTTGTVVRCRSCGSSHIFRSKFKSEDGGRWPIKRVFFQQSFFNLISMIRSCRKDHRSFL